MNLKDYQDFTPTTAVYDKGAEEKYLTAGLAGEVGELYSAIAKYHRGDYGYEEFLKRFTGEIGGVSWFIAQLCNYYGISWDEQLDKNVATLQDRMARKVIKGDGDFR